MAVGDGGGAGRVSDRREGVDRAAGLEVAVRDPSASGGRGGGHGGGRGGRRRNRRRRPYPSMVSVCCVGVPTCTCGKVGVWGVKSDDTNLDVVFVVVCIVSTSNGWRRW